MDDGSTCSVAAYGDRPYVVTGNGVQGQNEPTANSRFPDAPSLICLDKRKGTLLWQDGRPGGNILSGQWGSPLVAEIGGTVQYIAPQGMDGWLRSLEAETGRLLWEFDMNSQTACWMPYGRSERNFFMNAPVALAPHWEGSVSVDGANDPK